MKEDLQLFLHQHTDVFTAWLGDILNKLKQVTKNPKPAGDSPVKEKKVVASKKKEEKTSKKKKKKSTESAS